MAIKKSQLYSSLWQACDALRGGMDASMYKDYVLVLLFIKYVSDRYANQPDALIVVPSGGGFQDIVALKGKKDIGEKIDLVIGALAKANDLGNVIDNISFNDEEKLGKGKEMIDRLSELVGIFENEALNFSKNRAEGDDILGDAFEYLMRNFATESGKSKGQFYTPAEVSRIMAKVLGVANASNNTSFYDPTCGSGSLLLKVLDEAGGKGTLYGQEKDVSTAGLAKMNMTLHNSPTADIARGQSTLSNPQFLNKSGYLETFDYVVANPPFSLKNWTQGFNPSEDEFGRFVGYGIPPDKNGDFAFLLHLVKSLKSTGKGAIILPHGVLFRGNVEAEIRKNLIQKGYIKGIIGLPPNLFYGTGIPACIIVIDKENGEKQAALSEKQRGIFMIDAGKGFIKDGNKNRLRDQDIHKIVDVFTRQTEVSKYSRLVTIEEIADSKNDFNLNIPRYIDSQEKEDIQDIEAHLLGGIPNIDIDALQEYWNVYPTLRKELFSPSKRPKYSKLNVDKANLKQAIFKHEEYEAISQKLEHVFRDWEKKIANQLKSLSIGFKPKEIIRDISEDLLITYSGRPLLDKYDVYQHLMNYWEETMQDDCYIIAVDGWKAEVRRIVDENKKGAKVDKGWACDLVPPDLVIDQYFITEKENIEKSEIERDFLGSKLQELIENNSGEEGWFADYDKLNKATILKRVKELYSNKSEKKYQTDLSFSTAAEPDMHYGNYESETSEREVLEKYLQLVTRQSELGAHLKNYIELLDKKVLAKYATINSDEVKLLVVERKWMNAIKILIKVEMDNVSQRLTHRVTELAERYQVPLPQQNSEVRKFEEIVNGHLAKMGFSC